MQCFNNQILPRRGVGSPGDLILFQGRAAIVVGSIFEHDWVYFIQPFGYTERYKVHESELEFFEEFCDRVKDCSKCPAAAYAKQPSQHMQESHLHANACPYAKRVLIQFPVSLV